MWELERVGILKRKKVWEKRQLREKGSQVLHPKEQKTLAPSRKCKRTETGNSRSEGNDE